MQPGLPRPAAVGASGPGQLSAAGRASGLRLTPRRPARLPAPHVRDPTRAAAPPPAACPRERGRPGRASPRSYRGATRTRVRGHAGRAGAANRRSHVDNLGHERAPNPQIGPAARWSLDLPKLAYNDEVISRAAASLRGLPTRAGSPGTALTLHARWRRSPQCLRAWSSSPAVPAAAPPDRQVDRQPHRSPPEARDGHEHK
jgi:hypothetical protein